MQARRLEHPAKEMFVEIYWEGLAVEIISGAIGSKGRARTVECGTVREVEALIAAEVAKREKAGFVEVTPDAPLGVQAKIAPEVGAIPPEMLADIRAHPADDAPRLVYADYLLARGDPLGELIVIQCQRAALSRWDARQKRLAEREEQLVVAFRQRWVGTPLHAEVTVRYRRGFVDHIEVERRAWNDPLAATIVDRALARFPLLESLAVGGAGLLRSLGSPAAIARMRRLEVRGIGTGDPLEAALALVPLATSLAVPGCGLGRAQLRVLPTRPWRALDLSNNTLGINGTRAVLAMLAPPDALEELAVPACGVGDDGVRALAECALPNLRALDLGQNNLGPRAIASLATAADLRHLAHLVLARNPLAGADAARLAALPALVELDLADTGATDADVAAIAASPLADRLVSLRLRGCAITERGARDLAAAAWPALRHLTLGGNPLGAGTAVLKERFRGLALSVRAAAGP